MKKLFQNLLNYFMPLALRGKEDDAETLEEYKKVQLAISICLIIPIFPMIMFIVRFSMEGLLNSTLILLPITAVILPTLAFYIKKTGRYKGVILFIVLQSNIIIFFRTLDTGGMSSSVIFWFSFGPVASGLLFKGYTKYISNLISVAFLGVILYMERNNLVSDFEPSLMVRFGVIVIGFIALSYLVEIYDRYRDSFFLLTKKTSKITNEIEKMKSLSKLSAGVSHEINNPLQIINGNIERLKFYIEDQTKSKEDIVLVLDKILNTTKRIEGITASMRIYSSTKINYEMNEFNIEKGVKDFYLSKKDKIKKSINFVYKGLANDIHVLGNKTLLIEILGRLLDNSVEAVSGDTSEEIKWVEIELDRNDTTLFLTVTDNGCGIDLEHQVNIMEPFFSTKGVSHSGLGLSLTQGYCNYLDWSIRLNKMNKYTQFCVEIPIAREGSSTQSDAA